MKAIPRHLTHLCAARHDYGSFRFNSFWQQTVLHKDQIFQTHTALKLTRINPLWQLHEKPISIRRLLRSWVRIPPGAWIFVCCECRVLSGRGLCDELITRPEESYRLWCVVVCDLETSRMGAPFIYIYDISSLRVKSISKNATQCNILGFYIFVF